MRSRYEAYINGVALSSVSPDIYIYNIGHKPAAIKSTSAQLGNRNGSFLLDKYYTGPQVTISFEIHNYNIWQRQEICDAVVAWAQSGNVLETNDRQGKRLIADCLTPPSIDSARDWLDVLEVVFTAYERPFWEEKAEAKLSLGGTSGNGTLYVPGNVGSAFVEVTAKPRSGTMANLTVTAGNTSIALTGIAATASAPLVISYDDKQIMSIKRGNVSVLDKRSGTSSDDLLLECGKLGTLSFSASVACDIMFSVRGCWM